MGNFLRGQIAPPAVAFFGATEIQLRHEPIRTNTAYAKTGRLICVGVTDKTEFVWVDSELTYASRRLFAEMRRLTRWMKPHRRSGKPETQLGQDWTGQRCADSVEKVRFRPTRLNYLGVGGHGENGCEGMRL